MPLIAIEKWTKRWKLSTEMAVRRPGVEGVKPLDSLSVEGLNTMPLIAIQRWAKRWKLSPEDIHGLVDWLAERIVIKGEGRQKVPKYGGTPFENSAATEIQIQTDLIRMAQNQRRNLVVEAHKMEIMRESPRNLAAVKTEVGELDYKIEQLTRGLQRLREGNHERS